MSSIEARMIYLHALSPIHSGTGQAVAVIDLPIAREKATGWPIIPGSTLKGVLRDALEAQGPDWLKQAFGPPPQSASEHAGALCFADQRLLCLPVRSYQGTFAWVTSPLVLRRFRRDHEAVGLPLPFDAEGPILADEFGEIRVGPDSVLGRPKVLLEDLDLSPNEDPVVANIAEALANTLFPPDEQRIFTSRFSIVSDSLFDFLCETATEVTARVRLNDDTKTVANGGLWYEEAVPAEALFSGPVFVAPHRRNGGDALLAPLASLRTVQIGGNAGVGRGLCRVVVKP